MFNNWQKYEIDIPQGRRGGNIKVFCPQCHDTRHDRGDRSLSCNLDTGEFLCHYCGWKGCVAEEEQLEREESRRQWIQLKQATSKVREYRKPKPRPETAMSEKALAWFRSRGISENTLKAMRVTEGMEYMPQKQKECNTVQFNYYRDGELINTKYRTGDKCFKMTAGAELIPYNIDAVKDTDTVYITEGEMDALSLYEVGIRNVVSVPAGANANLTFLDGVWDGYFENKTQVYICSDTDSKGILLRDELIRRFGADICRVVTYGEGCKDANDLLMKSGRDALLQALADAKEVRIEGVFTVRDFEDSLDALFQHGLQKGVTIGHDNFDRLCSFETRRLCVVTGIPGSGKSEWIDEVAERLNMRYGWRFAYFSPENAPLAYHASKLASKMTGLPFGRMTMPADVYAAAKQRLEDDFSFISPADNFRLDNILDKARSLVRRRGIKCLVIDPYNRLECEVGSRSETLYISSVLDKLTTFAQLNDVLVILMSHPTKLQRDKDSGQIQMPTLYDIAGSAHFYNKADFGLIVHRDRADNTVIVRVSKVKFRHLGEPGDALFKYNTRNGRYVPYTVGMTDIPWDNRSHLRDGIAEVPDYTALGDGNHRYRGGEDEEQTAAPVQQTELQWAHVVDDDYDSPFGDMPF